MMLTIRSWFNEPSIEFKISYKVHKYIRQTIIEDIMTPYGLEKKDPDIYIGLVVSTSTDIKKLEVRGPEYDKRNKFINYGFWFPFKNIAHSNNYLKEYLNFFFDALVLLFENYDVPEISIRKVQKKIEKEVLSNPEYSYVE